VPEREKLKKTTVAEDVRVSDDPMAQALTGVARTLDGNADILNRLIFTYMDYAVVGYAPDSADETLDHAVQVISDARSKPASPGAAPGHDRRPAARLARRGRPRRARR